jgi:hypothetical protein
MSLSQIVECKQKAIALHNVLEKNNCFLIEKKATATLVFILHFCFFLVIDTRMSTKPWFFTPDNEQTDHIPTPMSILRHAFRKIRGEEEESVADEQVPSGPGEVVTTPQPSVEIITPSTEMEADVEVDVEEEQEVEKEKAVEQSPKGKSLVAKREKKKETKIDTLHVDRPLDPLAIQVPKSLELCIDEDGVLIVVINQGKYQICSGCGGYEAYRGLVQKVSGEGEQECLHNNPVVVTTTTHKDYAVIPTFKKVEDAPLPLDQVCESKPVSAVQDNCECKCGCDTILDTKHRDWFRIQTVRMKNPLFKLDAKKMHLYNQLKNGRIFCQWCKDNCPRGKGQAPKILHEPSVTHAAS